MGSAYAGSVFLPPHLAHLPLTPPLCLLGSDVKPTLSAGSSQACISIGAPVLHSACLGPTAAWTCPLGHPASSSRLTRQHLEPLPFMLDLPKGSHNRCLKPLRSNKLPGQIFSIPKMPQSSSSRSGGRSPSHLQHRALWGLSQWSHHLR